MSRRKGSLKFQVFEKVDSIKKFGQSKHKAKKAEKARCQAEDIKWNPARVPGVFSFREADVVKEKGLNFITWEKIHHPEQKILSEIPRSHVGEYLQERITKGLSAWTIRQDAAGLAKLFDCSSTDFGIQLPARNYQNIIKNRGPVKDFNFKKHADLVDLGNGIGMRRESADVLSPVNFFEKDGDLYAHLVEKGGKPRNALVREEYRERIMKLIEKRKGQEFMIDYYPHRTPWHRCRQEYTKGLYMQIQAKHDRDNPDRVMKLYRCRDGRIYERDILLEVSKNLGHNREDVIPQNYLFAWAPFYASEESAAKFNCDMMGLKKTVISGFYKDISKHITITVYHLGTVA